MSALFRSMREDTDGMPVVFPSARTLGVRPSIDIPAVLPNEIVSTQEGGLSVSPDDPVNLPAHRRPLDFGGTGKDPAWMIDEAQLGPDLCYRPDPQDLRHGFVEPARPMTLTEFEQAVARTRPHWVRLQPAGSASNGD